MPGRLRNELECYESESDLRRRASFTDLFRRDIIELRSIFLLIYSGSFWISSKDKCPEFNKKKQVFVKKCSLQTKIKSKMIVRWETIKFLVLYEIKKLNNKKWIALQDGKRKWYNFFSFTVWKYIAKCPSLCYSFASFCWLQPSLRPSPAPAVDTVTP